MMDEIVYRELGLFAGCSFEGGIGKIAFVVRP